MQRLVSPNQCDDITKDLLESLSNPELHAQHLYRYATELFYGYKRDISVIIYALHTYCNIHKLLGQEVKSSTLYQDLIKQFEDEPTLFFDEISKLNRLHQLEILMSSQQDLWGPFIALHREELYPHQFTLLKRSDEYYNADTAKRQLASSIAFAEMIYFRKGIQIGAFIQSTELDVNPAFNLPVWFSDGIYKASKCAAEKMHPYFVTYLNFLQQYDFDDICSSLALLPRKQQLSLYKSFKVFGCDDTSCDYRWQPITYYGGKIANKIPGNMSLDNDYYIKFSILNATNGKEYRDEYTESEWQSLGNIQFKSGEIYNDYPAKRYAYYDWHLSQNRFPKRVNRRYQQEEAKQLSRILSYYLCRPSFPSKEWSEYCQFIELQDISVLICAITLLEPVLKKWVYDKANSNAYKGIFTAGSGTLKISLLPIFQRVLKANYSLHPLLKKDVNHFYLTKPYIGQPKPIQIADMNLMNGNFIDAVGEYSYIIRHRSGEAMTAFSSSIVEYLDTLVAASAPPDLTLLHDKLPPKTLSNMMSDCILYSCAQPANDYFYYAFITKLATLNKANIFAALKLLPTKAQMELYKDICSAPENIESRSHLNPLRIIFWRGKDFSDFSVKSSTLAKIAAHYKKLDAPGQQDKPPSFKLSGIFSNSVSQAKAMKEYVKDRDRAEEIFLDSML